ncbi:MAG: AAA family ATPase, partial [Parafilimonas terrae]|nr:AAA family ATPase [Parafilimonas terrae]
PEPELTDAVIAYWMEQSWPGNARQLRHEVERAFVFAEGGRITVETVSRGKSAGREAPPAALPGHTLRDATLRTEADLVREAMVRLKGNKKRVAEDLGISRSYLYKLLAALEAEAPIS